MSPQTCIGYNKVIFIVNIFKTIYKTSLAQCFTTQMLVPHQQQQHYNFNIWVT